MKKQITAFGYPVTKHEVLDQFEKEQRYKWRFDFPNKYAVSIIRHKDGTVYKATVIGKDGCLDPNHPLMFGKPDWICINSVSVRAFLSRVASMTVLLIALSLSGCASIQAIQVCSATKCATGWYDDDGSVKTAAHAFLEGTSVDIETDIGYTDHGVVRSHEGTDTAVVVVEPWYKSRACYTEANIGDRVTILVYKGVVSGRIVAIRNSGNVYMLNAIGATFGDSGSPVVSKNGCIIGQLMGFLDGSVVAVKTSKNKQSRSKNK